MSLNVSSVVSRVPYVDGGVNVADGTAVQDSGRQCKCAEFVLTLGIRNGKSFKTNQVNFSVIAFPTAAQGVVTLDELIKGASIIASNIAAVSRGAVFGFYMKIGKYRNDEKTPNLSEKGLHTAYLRFDNVDVLLDSCGVPTSGIAPQRTVSQNIRIPYVGDNISLASLDATLRQLINVSENTNCSLGVSRFDTDGEKDTISAYQTIHKTYGKILELDKVGVISYLNNDQTIGDSDYIVSEEYNNTVLVPEALPTPPDHQTQQQNQGGNNNG